MPCPSETPMIYFTFYIVALPWIVDEREIPCKPIN